MRIFKHLLKQELLLAYRQRSDSVQPLLFFVIIVTLFPLAINFDIGVLQTLMPGIIWVAALLATQISLENLFRQDYEDGSLEQFILSPQPLFMLVFAKNTAHWLITGLPLILISPLLGILMHLSSHVMLILMSSLLLGTPALCFICGIGAALMVTLNRGGILLALVVLPLSVPVLIFGAEAVSYASMGLSVLTPLLLLAALLVLSFTLAPLAIVSALRVSVG